MSNLGQEVTDRLVAWEGNDSELAGEILYWASAVLEANPGLKDVKGALVNQIRYGMEKRGVSQEEYLDWLFSAKTADIFMLRLQI